jgi:hypothetical protein
MDDNITIEDRVRSIEEKMRKIRQDVVSTTAIEQLERELAEVKQQLARPKEIFYFSSKDSVPEQLYKVELVKEIIASVEFNKVRLIRNIDGGDHSLDLESSYLQSYVDDTDEWKKCYYLCQDRCAHIMELKERIKSEALAYAKTNRFDAVMINESSIKIDRPGFFNVKDEAGYQKSSDIKYRGIALATFYVRKSNEARW